MIKISGLHKSYGKVKLFKGIDLEVARGESVVLIGPSGSGKSSLLRCINGLETFDSGRIEIDGAAIDSKLPGRKGREALRHMRLKVGMVFQQFNLFPHMTVLENITIAPIKVLKVPKGLADEHAISLLKRINLESKIDTYPHLLSGGEQQRVAIVRALAMKPDAMLFDECTSSLDPEMTYEVLAVIRELVYGGLTSIISTHEMDFARDVADRVAVLDHGDIVELDTPENIFTNPKAERTKLFLSRVFRQ